MPRTTYKITSTERQPNTTPTPVTRRNWVLRDSTVSSLRPIERAPESTVKDRAYIIDIPYGQTRETDEQFTETTVTPSRNKVRNDKSIAKLNVNDQPSSSTAKDLPEPPTEIELVEFKNSLQRYTSIASVSTPAPPSFPKSSQTASTSTKSDAPSVSSFGAKARKVLRESFKFIEQEESTVHKEKTAETNVGRNISKWEERRSSEETTQPSALRRSTGQTDLASLGIHIRESESPDPLRPDRLTPHGGHLNTAYTCDVCENIRLTDPLGQCRLCAAFATNATPAFERSNSSVNSSVRSSTTNGITAANYQRPYVINADNDEQFASASESQSSVLSSRPPSIYERAIDAHEQSGPMDQNHQIPRRAVANDRSLVTLTTPNGLTNGTGDTAGPHNDTKGYASTITKYGRFETRSARRFDNLTHNRKFCLSVTFVVVLAMVIGVGIGLTIWFD